MNWASEAKLDRWVHVLPMLRCLEIQGIDATEADALLVPLAERFDLEVQDTPENEETFIANRMAPRAGPCGQISATGVLLALALLLPILLGLWLALRTALAPDVGEVGDVAAGAEAPGAEGEL